MYLGFYGFQDHLIIFIKRKMRRPPFARLHHIEKWTIAKLSIERQEQRYIYDVITSIFVCT